MPGEKPSVAAQWIGPVLAGLGFLVPLPVGWVLVGPLGLTAGLLVSAVVFVLFIGTGFFIISRQERAELARSGAPGGPRESGVPELDAQLAELRRRNRDA